jgi:hypothetical protein
VYLFSQLPNEEALWVETVIEGQRSQREVPTFSHSKIVNEVVVCRNHWYYLILRFHVLTRHLAFVFPESEHTRYEGCHVVGDPTPPLFVGIRFQCQFNTAKL